MNLKKIFSVGICLVSLLLSSTVIASPTNPSDIYSLINSEEFTKVNEPILFEAQSFSNTDLDKSEIKYTWDFGNQNFDQGTKVVHRYKNPGRYTVQLTTSDNQNQQTTTIKEIFVSKTNILLLSDYESKKESINQFKKTAESFGVFVNILSAYDSPSPNIATEIILQNLQNKRSIGNYQYILDWTKQGLSKELLQKYKQKSSLNANNANLILVDNTSVKKFTNNDKKLLGINQIISIKKPALYTLLESASHEKFMQQLDEQQHDYEVVDTNQVVLSALPLSNLFEILRSKGINENSLYLLVIIPFLALSITILKQVIGLEAIGFYTPLITTLALLNIGIKTGFIIFLLLYLFSYLSYRFITKLKLHYLAKNALVVSIFSVLAIIFISLIGYVNIEQIKIINFAIFPLVVLITVVESFAKQIYSSGYKTGSHKVLSTFLLCTITYILAGGELGFLDYRFAFLNIKNLLINTPEINIIFIFCILYLGKWKGLKLTEYYRLKKYNDNIEE